MARRPFPALVLAIALGVAACAPAASDPDPETVTEAGQADADTAQAVAESGALQDASEAAAEAEAAAQAEAGEAEAERVAAEEARKAEWRAEVRAEAEAQRKAERAAARKAAEEEAARKAAEEEARRKAEEAAKQAREAQERLKDLGYYTGGIDGDAGPMTVAAVKDFQAVNDLKVDGVIGAQTEAALRSDSAKSKPPPPKPEPDDDGDDGPDLPDGGVLSVSDAQRVLRDLDYYGGDVNGSTTDAFRSALVAFQKVEGISADGSLGPQTSSRLRDPRTPSLKGGNSNRIEIDLDRQVIHVVKDGNRIRTMPTSSGNGEQYQTSSGGTANAKTPVGDFVIERRITGLREADLGSLYDPLYFYKGWAIHGSNSVPSYPASHGCTRVTRSDILWLANQMPNGTQVRIYGGQHTFIPTG